MSLHLPYLIIETGSCTFRDKFLPVFRIQTLPQKCIKPCGIHSSSRFYFKNVFPKLYLVLTILVYAPRSENILHKAIWSILLGECVVSSVLSCHNKNLKQWTDQCYNPMQFPWMDQCDSSMLHLSFIQKAKTRHIQGMRAG